MYQASLSKQPEIQLQPFLTHDVNRINEAEKERNKRQKWRTSLYMFVLLGCVVLVVNTAFLTWALFAKGSTNGTGIFYKASCDATKRANTGVHLLINILSSALLGASNYCMQCLSAPTRPEVENAHRRGSWLDVGIPSLRNVLSSSLETRKKLCWWILALSSFPLHLCYNSVVFMSTSAQTYGVFQFGPEAKTAIENGVFKGSKNSTFGGGYYGNDYVSGQVYAEAFKAGQVKELTPLECINAYSVNFQATRGNVFLVLDEGAMAADEIYAFFPEIKRTGVCSTQTGTTWVYQQFSKEAGTCFEQEAYRFLPRLQADPSIWAPFERHRVRSCLSEFTDQKCTLNFSVHLIIIVIVFNVIKIFAFLIGVSTLRNDPMLTVGDAVASFLREPDATAHSMCLVSQQEINKAGVNWPARQQPRILTKKAATWSRAVKRGERWTVGLALTAGIVVLLFLFLYAYRSVRASKDIDSVLSIALGSVDARTIVQTGTASSGLSGLFQNVMIANSPQLVVSLIYLSYNATMTSMLLAHEWSGFSTRRKPLRVSTTLQGHQRSAYFLQLPYRYALPLLATSTLLHWLASESIFVVSVQLYNMHGEHSSDGTCYQWKDPYLAPNGDSFNKSCGTDFISLSYSPLGILLSLIVATTMMIVIFALGRKKLSPAPVVGSCSAAIAASCYARLHEHEPWEKDLKWGAFVLQDDQQHFDTPHCGLSSLEVDQPIVGQAYA